MKSYFNKCVEQIYAGLASTAFFIFTIVVFALHSLWIALSSNLLPYDEYYHLGIIQIYAKQWSPFISSQSFDAGLYGDITRLPSYFYHYLMSFPYRVLDFFIDNEALLVVGTRILNIAMVVAGLILFRVLFLKAGVSKRITNCAVAFFAFTPIVSLLAAQNNYDNFMFFLTPLFLLFGYKILTEPEVIANYVYFLSIGMVISIVKHSFLAVFLAAGAFILIAVLIKNRGRVKTLFVKIKENFREQGLASKLVMLSVLLLSLGLFVERHGMNMLRYQQINVDCAKVQPVEVCSQYSPWRRNQIALIRNYKQQDRYSNPASFSIHWVATIMRGYNSIFANIVPDDLNQPDPFGHYVFKPLLPLPIVLGYGALGLGILAVLQQRKRIFKNEFYKLLLVCSLALTAALWLFNYTFYVKYGRAYAVQARYLLIFTLPVIVIMLDALNGLVKSVGFKRVALIGVLGVYMYCGGAVGWIIRADNDWYWNNQTIKSINSGTQVFLNKVVPN